MASNNTCEFAGDDFCDCESCYTERTQVLENIYLDSIFKNSRIVRQREQNSFEARCRSEPEHEKNNWLYAVEPAEESYAERKKKGLIPKSRDLVVDTALMFNKKAEDIVPSDYEHHTVNFHYIERKNIQPDFSSKSEKWLVDDRLDPDIRMKVLIDDAFRGLTLNPEKIPVIELHFSSFDNVVLRNECKGPSWHKALHLFDVDEAEKSVRRDQAVLECERRKSDMLRHIDSHESGCMCQTCADDLVSFNPEIDVSLCDAPLTRAQVLEKRVLSIRSERDERLFEIRALAMQKDRENKVAKRRGKRSRRKKPLVENPLS
jgi:hypothetical protein